MFSFFEKNKRFIAMALIVASVMTNNGMFTFANSVGEVISNQADENTVHEPKNYYLEYLEETYTIEYTTTEYKEVDLFCSVIDDFNLI